MSDKTNIENGAGASYASDSEAKRPLFAESSRIAADTITDAEKVFGDAVKQVANLARKHPIEAVAVGFGVGCLVGLLLGRR